jgi:hypothetical protein
MSKKKVEETNRDKLRFVCIQCDAEGKLEGVAVEREVHFLKACSVCGVENWCFLVGSSRLTVAEVVQHLGEGSESNHERTPREAARIISEIAGVPLPEGLPEEAESTPEAEIIAIGGTQVKETIVEGNVITHVLEDEIEAEDAPDEKQAEIERLKAELAKLEGE